MIPLSFQLIIVFVAGVLEVESTHFKALISIYSYKAVTFVGVLY